MPLAEEQPTEIYRELSKGKTARFDLKRVHLLTCAARVFADQGYEKASMRQVAQAADFSLAGLYHYVSCKEELLFFIQYHTFGLLTEWLEELLQRDGSPESQLREMVLHHVKYQVDHLSELKLCATELDSLGGDFYQQVLDRRQRYFELTRQIIKRLGDSGQALRIDPNLAALYLFGMLNWIVMWFDPQRNDPKELADSLVELFLNGIKKTSLP
ncbi:MAG: TetR family transcriptional regulator [Deltaproteobacteria bacterium]|nr:TetR family transcriptional regulator [Deltaproteobacteria bacterium]